MSWKSFSTLILKPSYLDSLTGPTSGEITTEGTVSAEAAKPNQRSETPPPTYDEVENLIHKGHYIDPKGPFDLSSNEKA